MVDAGLLQRRIDALLQHTARLRAFRAVARDAFVADPDTHHLAERHLHLAVEAAIDIANHLVSDAGGGAPETYRASFATLGRLGLVEAGLAARLQRWAGLRDILVHAYLDIDHALVHEIIAGDLDDLDQLAAAAARLL